MGSFLLRRFGIMLLTALALTFVVFFLTNLYPNLEKLAKTQGNMRMSDQQVSSWLDNRGYSQNIFVRYAEWLGIAKSKRIITEDGKFYSRCSRLGSGPEDTPHYCGVLQGDMGQSTVFKENVSTIIAKRLSLTGWLMLAVLGVMIPVALIIGIIAGMREGSRTDRTLSTFSIATTATPEYVSGVILIVFFASSKMGLSPLLAEWGWIEGRTLFKGSATSAMDTITWNNFTLPVAALALYGMGYIARMTRASLRNALIAPFTVIMLQIPWLLTGVVIIETLFNYKGFGWSLVQAASGNDIELLLGISVIAVIVVLLTQLISDIGYVFLNPRIRVS